MPSFLPCTTCSHTFRGSSHEKVLDPAQKIDELLGNDVAITMKIDADTNGDEIHYGTDKFESYLVFDPESTRRLKLFTRTRRLW